jgi:hypothetical protein
MTCSPFAEGRVLGERGADFTSKHLQLINLVQGWVYRGISLIRNTPSEDPTVALFLRIYGEPRGVGVSYERGTPVAL